MEQEVSTIHARLRDALPKQLLVVEHSSYHAVRVRVWLEFVIVASIYENEGCFLVKIYRPSKTRGYVATAESRVEFVSSDTNYIVTTVLFHLKTLWPGSWY